MDYILFCIRITMHIYFLQFYYQTKRQENVVDTHNDKIALLDISCNLPFSFVGLHCFRVCQVCIIAKDGIFNNLLHMEKGFTPFDGRKGVRRLGSSSTMSLHLKIIPLNLVNNINIFIVV